MISKSMPHKNIPKIMENKMENINIQKFIQNKEQVKGKQVVSIFVPYGYDYSDLKEDMKILGFTYTSIQFVGCELMDTIQHFRKT